MFWHNNCAIIDAFNPKKHKGTHLWAPLCSSNRIAPDSSPELQLIFNLRPTSCILLTS